MNETFDMLMMCGAAAFTIGGVLGYQLGCSCTRTEIRERIARQPDVVRAKREVTRVRETIAHPRQVIPLVKLPAPIPFEGPGHVEPVVKLPAPTPIPSAKTNPWRSDVVAGLMNAGFKKADAVSATDACDAQTKAAGLSDWMRAALSNATKKEAR